MASAAGVRLEAPAKARLSSIASKDDGMTFLIVFLGGGLGAAMRHGFNLLISFLVLRSFGADFPVATLAVNVSGCFLMGAIVGYLAFTGEISEPWRLFLTTGALGGFTTFSTFSLETVLLFERGESAQASFYVMASVGLGVAALFGGVSLMRHFS